MGFLVIRSDNFGRSGERAGFDEKIVSRHSVMKDAAAEVRRLNESACEDGPYFYSVFNEGQKLAKFEL